MKSWITRIIRERPILIWSLGLVFLSSIGFGLLSIKEWRSIRSADRLISEVREQQSEKAEFLARRRRALMEISNQINELHDYVEKTKHSGFIDFSVFSSSRSSQMELLIGKGKFLNADQFSIFSDAITETIKLEEKIRAGHDLDGQEVEDILLNLNIASNDLRMQSYYVSKDYR